ncbi:DegT/DnrJ/EryC1/StrS family aminotransferase [Ensifer canadensis]
MSDKSRSFIPVYRPDLTGNERAYVLDCVDSSWISSLGVYVEKFERMVADYVGAKHAIAVSNGTVALHLALHCLGIGPGDEVIVPTFTYISSVNTITQTGATPVFVDSLIDDWSIDIEDVKRKITKATKAIMPVHLYGYPCDMPTLRTLADEHGIALVEDCAEALGSTTHDRHVGAWSDVATYSFFGNKTITTGEGGAVTTDNDELAAALRKVKGQGQSLTKRYWHDVVGFNYRMTNIAAAIGVAQMERIDATLRRKQAIAQTYRQLLKDSAVEFQAQKPSATSSDWLVSLLLPRSADRERVMSQMAELSVETRPVFYCAHHMPMYRSTEKLDVAEEISRRGISLPSFPSLTDDEQTRVAESLIAAIR